MAPYQYHALEYQDSIRILELHPAIDSFAPLEGKILHMTLEDAEDNFEAISYACGEFNPVIDLKCGSGTSILITENLASALRRFRHIAQDRFLWVDAICIHQADLEERASQVSLMSRIFASARMTLVWLGEEDQNTKRALKCCQILSQGSVDSKKVLDTSGLSKCFGNRSPEWRQRHNQILENEECGKAVMAFFGRPWFGRRWVVQESALAKDVILFWGSYSIHWETVLICVKLLLYSKDSCSSQSWNCSGQKGESNVVMANNMLLIRLERWNRVGPPKPEPILDLLYDLRRHDCADPRDLIYSLIGVASDLVGFSPNYKDTFPRTFQRFADHCLFKNQDLRILGFSGLKQRSEYSYVPHWNNNGETLKRFNITHFQAATREKPRIEPSWRATPRIHGYLLDQFSEVIESAGLDNLASSRRVKRIITNWQNISELADSSVYKNRLFNHCAFVHTIVNSNRNENTYPYLGENESLQGIEDAYKRLCQTFNNHPDPDTAWRALVGEKSRPKQNGKRYEIDPLSLAKAIDKTCRSRSFAITKSGYMSLVPPETSITDVIGIFSGSGYPFVLRPNTASDGQRVYKVVGACYVHGMMDGEIFNRPGTNKEVFELT